MEVILDIEPDQMSFQKYPALVLKSNLLSLK